MAKRKAFDALELPPARPPPATQHSYETVAVLRPVTIGQLLHSYHMAVVSLGRKDCKSGRCVLGELLWTAGKPDSNNILSFEIDAILTPKSSATH